MYLAEHAMDPPDLVKTNGKTKFVEQEQGATLKKKRDRTEEEYEEEYEEEVEEEEQEAHGEDYDVNNSAPRTTQDEEYHFRLTPHNNSMNLLDLLESLEMI
uniref:Uncharacterized protein n=1 Tax=Solanum tuberosum TaxID=4113 RepID=M1DYU9_SOLTU